MNTETIKALRSETEALRMLIAGIEQRLAQQQRLLDQLLEEAKQAQPVIPTLKEAEPAPQPIVAEKAEMQAADTITKEQSVEKPAEQPAVKAQPNSLNELLERKNLSDFRKAFSLNDRFRFRRELFGGSEELMNQVIADLNEIKSYEESVAYIHKVVNGNGEEAAVADFLQLIEKRFA